MIKLNSISSINLSINDINELACEIGKECERLIASFGIDNANEIVSKCITALQMLEKLSNEREKAVQEVKELEERIQALEKGKLEKLENQKAYEKDLESIEQIWTTETEELHLRIKQLQNENRKLLEQKNQNLQKCDSRMALATSIDNITGALYAEEYKMNVRLKDQIKKLEIELKIKQNEIESKDLEILELSDEINELKAAQKQMRRQSRAMETQVKTLFEERETILAEMQDQRRNYMELRSHLSTAVMEGDSSWYDEELGKLFAERVELNEKVEKLEAENQKLRSENTFGDQMQRKIDELLNSVELTRIRQAVGMRQEKLALKSEDNMTKFEEIFYSFLSENREKHPSLWRKIEENSMLSGTLFETPI